MGGGWKPCVSGRGEKHSSMGEWVVIQVMCIGRCSIRLISGYNALYRLAASAVGSLLDCCLFLCRSQNSRGAESRDHAWFEAQPCLNRRCFLPLLPKQYDLLNGCHVQKFLPFAVRLSHVVQLLIGLSLKTPSRIENDEGVVSWGVWKLRSRRRCVWEHGRS